MTNEKNYRVLVDAELRTAPDGRSISGYAATYAAEADLGGFRERVLPGAFRRTLQQDDPVMLANHDPSLVLGRMRAGTLELKEDSKGLHFRCLMPHTSYGHDLLESVKRGDIRDCSFGFIKREDRWPARDLRELVEVKLLDTSIVTFPAYSGTSVAARSLKTGGESVGIYRRTVSDAVSDEELELLRARLRLAQLL